MKKKMIWRLSNRPTPSEVQDLMSSGIITKEEAREILFSEQEDTERDVKSLETEIKFLRELVERLSKGSQTQIIETIRYIEKPYNNYPWYRPYAVWCSAGGSLYASGTNAMTTGNITNLVSSGTNVSTSGGFQAISTF